MIIWTILMVVCFVLAVYFLFEGAKELRTDSLISSLGFSMLSLFFAFITVLTI